MSISNSALLILVILLCYFLVARLPSLLKVRSAQRKQEERDEHDYWEYKKQHDEIRSRFDPDHSWNEATTLPPAYKVEVRSLNWAYRAMLQRRNGWTVEDFADAE